MVRIEKSPDGHEERYVDCDGRLLVLVYNELGDEWAVLWSGGPPSKDYHPQLGTLSARHVPGATRTTGLEIVGIDQIDFIEKEKLMRRVAALAGLDVRPARGAR